jgi:hypothetical protein
MVVPTERFRNWIRENGELCREMQGTSSVATLWRYLEEAGEASGVGRFSPHARGCRSAWDTRPQ